QPLASCDRCHGMNAGWNKRYILHCLVCREAVSESTKFLILIGIVAFFVFAVPIRTERVPPAVQPAGVAAIAHAAADSRIEPALAEPEPAAVEIEKFLARHDVAKLGRPRIAHAIAASSRKYGLDARLLASIMIVESGADPSA